MRHTSRQSAFLLIGFTAVLCATPAPLDVPKTVQAIGEKFKSAKEYTLEGDLVLDGQRGSAPGKILSHAKIKLASAPSGKYYLRLEPEGGDAYLLLSDGQKSWAFVPKLKQYTEEEAAGVEDNGDEADS